MLALARRRNRREAESATGANLFFPQSHSSGFLLFRCPRTSRNFFILSCSCSIWGKKTGNPYKPFFWALLLQQSASLDRTQLGPPANSNPGLELNLDITFMSLSRGVLACNCLPPGQQNSCDPSRLGTTGRSLFHSAQCHSGGCSTWAESVQAITERNRKRCTCT